MPYTQKRRIGQVDRCVAFEYSLYRNTQLVAAKFMF
jgi:hypothetical protein